MTKFKEGQEVEVAKEIRARGTDIHQNYVRRWCKAKIVKSNANKIYRGVTYCVEFPSGSRAVLDAGHIRAAQSYDQSGLSQEQYEKLGGWTV